MQAGAEQDLLKAAMKQAHLPSLIVTLAQLTGRMDLLREEWRPKYIPYTDQYAGGLSEAAQAALAETLLPLIPPLLGRAASSFKRPDDASLRTLMNFVAGVEIPEKYVPLLEEELGLDRLAAGEPQPPAAKQDIKILIVGAGMSGIAMGVKLREAGYEDFTIIERDSDVGGTWHANTYPGCRVDSPNHLYSFSFFPNYDWPHRYSQQHALKAYLRDAADHYGLWPHIRLNTSLDTAEYDARSGKWRAHIVTQGGRETLEVDAVISAVGQLNRPKIPDFKGRERFAGVQMHSATWRNDMDFAGKRVAVIGTGASAFQLIPEIAGKAKRVTVFQRTAPWVAPTPDYHREVGDGQNYLFRKLPYYANWVRFWLFWTMTEGSMPALKIDPDWKATDGSISAMNQRVRGALIERMREQAGERADLMDRIVPKSVFGGKRTLRDDGRWIATLKRDDVALVSEKIREITADSVIAEDGGEYPADVIIYGTGFHAARFLEPIKIIGSNGVELTQLWRGDPRAYLGMTVPGFPNFFCIYGPNTNLVAQGSIVFFSECSARYIVGALDMIRARGAASIEPKEAVHDTYNAAVDAENERMAWGMPGVTNWYKSETGRVSQNWPFPLVDYWRLTQAPDPEDFIFHTKKEAA